MNVVVRHYRAGTEFIDELERRSAEVEELIRGVPGFVSYYLVRTPDGGASISVYEDSAGTEESTRRATAWVSENLASLHVPFPEVIEGETAIRFAR